MTIAADAPTLKKKKNQYLFTKEDTTYLIQKIPLAPYLHCLSKINKEATLLRSILPFKSALNKLFMPKSY